jgi:hypothetical protein
VKLACSFEWRVEVQTREEEVLEFFGTYSEARTFANKYNGARVHLLRSYNGIPRQRYLEVLEDGRTLGSFFRRKPWCVDYHARLPKQLREEIDSFHNTSNASA